MEPRRGRWRVWTLPFIFGEERRIKKFLKCFCVYYREIWWEKRGKNAQKPPFSLLVQFRVPGAIYRPWHSSQGLAAFQGPLGRVGGHTRAIKLGPADVSNFVLMHFSSSNFGRTFWGLLGLVLRRYWFPRKLWMSIFIKLKKLKIQRLGSMLMHFSQFSQYLNRFNFYFNTWIIVGMRIWLSSLWHWFQSILASRSKLVFLDPPKIDSKSNLVKVAKNLRGAQVRYKTMKNVVFVGILTLFDLWSTQGWPRAFWSFWLKMVLWALQCPNGLCHAIIYVLVTPRREKYIFGFSRVWHAIWGRTKYGINTPKRTQP